MKTLYGLVTILLFLYSCGTGTVVNAEGNQPPVLTDEEADAILAAGGETVCFVPDDQLRETLSPLQYAVTQEGGTETPFQNEYWNNHEKGLYVDIISGVPLFASNTKYDSGTGWPSFFQPISQDAVLLVKDTSYGMVRIEVRSASSGAHLGHVFSDGPAPTGLRYCMNSASLRFIPADKIVEAGYDPALIGD